MFISTFETFSTHFLQALENVDIGDRKLILHDVIPGELEQAIEQDKADFGITYIPIPTRNVEHIKITSILMGVYKRRGAFKNIPQERLPFVVPSFPLSGTPTRAKGLDGWPEESYTRKVKFEVSLIESAMELARQGKCVGYFPSFIVDRHNQKFRDQFFLERHPYSKEVKRCFSDVYLVKRKDRIEDKDMRLISKLIRIGTRLERID